MSSHWDLLSSYVQDVFGYWWVLIPTGLLTGIGFIGNWFKWKRLQLSVRLIIIATVVGVFLAQFLAYRDLWWKHNWMKSEVLSELIGFSQEGELILNDFIQECKTHNPGYLKEGEVDTRIEKWENRVIGRFKEIGASESDIALFQSDTGYYLPGWIFTVCPDHKVATILSKLDHKIQLLKGMWSNKGDSAN